MSEPLPILLSHPERAALLAAAHALPPDGLIVEWGSGGSTRLLGETGRRVVSIEHDLEWVRKVQADTAHLPNVEIRHHASPFKTYFGQPEEESPAGLEGYIIEFPPRAGLFFVDGLARGAVLATIRRVARPEARIFLHDYHGREAWYEWALWPYKKVALTDSLLELHA